jgi:glycosyltransferase involved in cell wall biosynthesis
VRARRPDAQLTVIGCRPDVSEPGVSVLGYLRKDVPAEAEVIAAALREATIFCMPSLWESTGLVYMEASLYGLPVVMVAGQGREEIFEAGALILDDADPERLAVALVGLADDPDRMRATGAAGRSLVLDRYMWPRVAQTVAGYLAEAVGERSAPDRTARDVSC